MPLVVILGMHRSGTSLLTHSLHKAGLHLGKNPLLPNSYNNLEGFWEAPESLVINDRILELSGGAWNTVPPTLRIDDETTSKMLSFLDGLRIERVAGWKDPRTTITFPVWKPQLSDYRIVAALRHPMDVARSLQVREGWSLDKGLQLWAEYNRRLLQTTDDEQNVLWFDFDQTPDEIGSNIRGICQRLGLDSSTDANQFNQFLRHHQTEESIADPSIAELYQTLHERSRVFQQECATSNVMPSATQSGIDDRSSLATRIEQLARVQSLENACVQELYALHNAAQTNSSQLQGRQDALEHAALANVSHFEARINELHHIAQANSSHLETRFNELHGLAQASSSHFEARLDELHNLAQASSSHWETRLNELQSVAQTSSSHFQARLKGLNGDLNQAYRTLNEKICACSGEFQTRTNELQGLIEQTQTAHDAIQRRQVALELTCKSLLSEVASIRTSLCT